MINKVRATPARLGDHPSAINPSLLPFTFSGALLPSCSSFYCFTPFKCANANKLQATALKETLNPGPHSFFPHMCCSSHTEGSLFHLTLKLLEPPLQLVVVEGSLA